MSSRIAFRYLYLGPQNDPDRRGGGRRKSSHRAAEEAVVTAPWR